MCTQTAFHVVLASGIFITLEAEVLQVFHAEGATGCVHTLAELPHLKIILH